jgi:hypothetical protein
MTRPIDEERRGAIDSAADTTTEIPANTNFVFALFKHLQKCGLRQT